jgi:hypothetical protein
VLFFATQLFQAPPALLNLELPLLICVHPSRDHLPRFEFFFPSNRHNKNSWQVLLVRAPQGNGR